MSQKVTLDRQKNTPQFGAVKTYLTVILLVLGLGLVARAEDDYDRAQAVWKGLGVEFNDKSSWPEPEGKSAFERPKWRRLLATKPEEGANLLWDGVNDPVGFIDKEIARIGKGERVSGELLLELWAQQFEITDEWHQAIGAGDHFWMSGLDEKNEGTPLMPSDFWALKRVAKLKAELLIRVGKDEAALEILRDLTVISDRRLPLLQDLMQATVWVIDRLETEEALFRLASKYPRQAVTVLEVVKNSDLAAERGICRAVLGEYLRFARIWSASDYRKKAEDIHAGEQALEDSGFSIEPLEVEEVYQQIYVDPELQRKLKGRLFIELAEIYQKQDSLSLLALSERLEPLREDFDELKILQSTSYLRSVISNRKRVVAELELKVCGLKMLAHRHEKGTWPIDLETTYPEISFEITGDQVKLGSKSVATEALQFAYPMALAEDRILQK